MPDSTEKEPSIFVIATPIGNLEDISLRAKGALESCDLIACEDTRMTQKLLGLLGLKQKNLMSYHDKVEHKKAEPLIRKIKEECLHLALVSDAGTPLISDPGYHLIRLAHQHGVKVIPVPGASSLTALVSASGLPSTKVLFTGFLSKKDSQKKTEMASWKNIGASIVFFETALRLEKTLGQLLEIYPQSEICLGKELTKHHELVLTDKTETVLDFVQNKLTLKGEYVLMLHLGDQSKNLSEEERIEMVRSVMKEFPELKVKELSHKLKDYGISSKEAYEMILKIKKA